VLVMCTLIAAFWQRLNGEAKHIPTGRRTSPCIPKYSGTIRLAFDAVHTGLRQGQNEVRMSG